MDDLLKLLDGSVDDVKTGLTGKSHDELLKLKAAETGGKTRKSVLDAIEVALSAAEAQRTGGFVQADAVQTGVLGIAAALDTSAPANVAAATDFSTSGAPRQVTEFDAAHPAVDADPRAGTTEHQNRIDFNDPLKPGHEVVEENLKAADAA